MALVRKLQKGDKAPDPNIPKDYSQVEKALYDNLYSMSSKEARRAKPAYDQVAALVRSGAMDKALKFNADRTYSIDTNQLPEELKKLDWTGHAEPLKKDMLGLGVTVRGEDSHKEALSSAMAALRTHVESTPAAAPTSGQTGYSKDIQNLINYAADKHFHNDLNAIGTHFDTFKTNDERKAKLLTWAKEGVDDYLADYDKNKDSYTYKDHDNAQALKLALSESNPNWDKISEKALSLGWNLNDYLLAPKSQTELDTEKKLADEKLAAAAKSAAPVPVTPHKPQAYIRRITTTYFHPKAKPTETGSGKWGDILRGKGSTEDNLDALALGADAVSLVGGVPGFVAGLGSTGLTLASDIRRGHGFGETAGNLALNLGFAGLSLIPGAATAKIGAKSAKVVAESAKVAKYGVPELKAVLKGTGAVGKYVAKPIAKVAKPAMIGAGLVSAGTAARQTAQDVQDGGLGAITVGDTKGLMHGVQSLRALRNMAQVHAGTTKVQTQEASTDFALKNPPKGIDAKITIPKGSKPEDVINTHFDKVINPKMEELKALEGKETPDKDAIAKLKEEIETLTRGKEAAKIDKGWMGIKGKVDKITGRNDNKAQSERVIKKEADPRSWYSKKFQERSIAKLNKNNSTGTPVDLKKLEVIASSKKSRPIDYKKDVLARYARRNSLNKSWKEYQNNMVEHKEGGVIQFQQGGPFKMDFTVLGNALKEGKLRKAGFTNESIGTSGHTFTNNKGISVVTSAPVKQTPIISKPVNKVIIPPKVTVAQTANTTYKHQGSGNYLPYSDLKDVSTWQTKDGKYTPEYSNFVNSLDENWLARNREDLNKFIHSAGSNVAVKDLAQVKGLATDKKYGPYHNYMVNKFNESATRLESKNKGFEVAGVKVPTTLSNTPTGIKSGTTGEVKGTGIKFPKLDKVDLLNTAMYLNTIRTNKDIGNAQRKGVADSMYTLPYMANTYIRADRPHSLEAEKQAAAVNSKTARMAASSSDTEKGFGARLAGIAQGNAIKDKAQMMDTQRLDQLRAQQLQMNAGTAKYNTEILGKNRGLAANAFKQIHGINAEQSLAQNTALNNLLLANQKNDAMKKQREFQTGIYNVLNDSKYKQYGEEYSALSDEANNPFRKNYENQMKTPGVTQVDWDKSADYNKWQAALKAKEAQIKPFNERLKNIQMMMAYGQSMKKGGKLAKKVEADRKQFYKVINSVNDPVDKHAIDLSRAEKNALDSDKLFYETIASNNKKVN